MRAQQVRQLVERGRLVVDREHAQSLSLTPIAPPLARTPGWNFGTRMLDLGARAERGLHHQTVLVAEGGAQPIVHIGQPDVPMVARSRLGERVGEPGAQQLRVHPDAVVLDGDHAVGALVAGDDADRAAAPARDSPCRTAFSTSGWRARNGTTTPSTSGATCSLTCNRVAEPGPFDASGTGRCCAAPRPAW